MNSLHTQVKKSLVERRDAISRLIVNNVDAHRSLDEAAATDARDHAAGLAAAAVLERVKDTESRELLEIKAAIQRIDDGTYGKCGDCGGPIGRQRLHALPEARTCINCSDRAERGA